MTTSRFKPGESGNKNGRPPGKTAGAKIREAIEKDSHLILKAVIDAAICGDMQACKMLLDRITPPLKPQAMPVVIEIGDTLPETGGNVISATMDGQIPPDIGSQLITALSNQAKIIEQQEIIERLSRIEKQLLQGTK